MQIAQSFRRTISIHTSSALALAVVLALAGGCHLFGNDGETGASKTDGDYEKEKAMPRLLIIGDSISMGYTPFVKEMLADEAEVLHNPGNAASTLQGVKKIDGYIGEGDWDVVVLNHGLHDLKFVDENLKNTRDADNGSRQVELDDYEKNLDQIVRRIHEKTDATLLFATTTPFPDIPAGPLRYAADVDRYNAAALRVMRRNKVDVIDLHDAVKDRLGELQQPNNVHFNRDGSRFLAEHVAGAVRKALEKR